MARFRSEAYYEKTGTMSIVTRATGKRPTQILRLIELGLIEPGLDEYTGFNLFSAEDVDKVKFIFFCRDRLGMTFSSMAYWMNFLISAMPDLSWTEIQDVMVATANSVEEKQRRRAVALAKLEQRGAFGRRLANPESQVF